MTDGPEAADLAVLVERVAAVVARACGGGEIEEAVVWSAVEVLGQAARLLLDARPERRNFIAWWQATPVALTVSSAPVDGRSPVTRCAEPWRLQPNR